MEVIVEKIDLHKIPMSQRKYVGMVAQRHLENKKRPGTVAEVCSLLQQNIDNSENSADSRAARWLLCRLRCDSSHARQYISELLYG